MEKPPIQIMLEGFAERVIERAQRNIGSTSTIKVGGKSRKRKIDSSGTLRKSLDYTLKKSSGGYRINFGATGKAKDYVDVVELGRRKGARQPPVEAILEWMRIKPIRLRNKDGGFVKASESQKRSVAFAIARRISKNGIPATYFYRDAFSEEFAIAEPEIVEAFRQLIAYEMRTALGANFTET